MARTDESSAKPARGGQLPLWLAAVWSGAAVMAFELVGARLLMPAFGMGIEVWAAVIATTLGFLAIGYWIGGKIADARPTVVTPGVVLFLAGASLLVVRGVGQSITGLLANMSFVTGSWCSATMILAAPLFLLGMVPPILARLMVRATERTGSVVGGLLAAATIGSMIGTALTGLVLLPGIGVSMTLLMLGGGTMAVAVIILIGAGRWVPAGGALIVAAAITSMGWRLKPVPQAVGPMKVFEQVEGVYGQLEVLEYRGMPVLVCNGIFQTVLPALTFGIMPGTLIRGRDYIELIPYFRPQARTALLIGLGGGLHEQALALYDITVHAVEIEPAVVSLAAEYFGLTADVTIADGRAFLARDRRQFDAVILDTFLGGTVPEHLYTKEAFEQAADRLTPDGVLAIHLITRPRHAATCAVARTVEAVFPHIVAIRSGIGDELQHVYLFASRSDLELYPEQLLELDSYGFTGQEVFDLETDGGPLLTDDRTCLALLSRDLVAQHRRLCLQQRRTPSW